VLGLCFAIAVLPGSGTSIDRGGESSGGPTQSFQAKKLGVCKNDICRFCIPYGIFWVMGL